MAPAAALFCSLRERWNELFIFKDNFVPVAATEPQPFVSDAWNNAGGFSWKLVGLSLRVISKSWQPFGWEKKLAGSTVTVSRLRQGQEGMWGIFCVP